jgi:hypothetical protein
VSRSERHDGWICLARSKHPIRGPDREIRGYLGSAETKGPRHSSSIAGGARPGMRAVNNNKDCWYREIVKCKNGEAQRCGDDIQSARHRGTGAAKIGRGTQQAQNNRSV